MARCRGRSLHPVRSFQVAVAVRIERQQICNLWRHHPEGRRQVISSLCTAREFCLRSFGPADRRPSACSNLPPLPRQLLRSRIRLSASSWISGRMALSFPIWQSYLRFWKTIIFVFKLSSFSTYASPRNPLCFTQEPPEDNSLPSGPLPISPWLALPVAGALEPVPFGVVVFSLPRTLPLR